MNWKRRIALWGVLSLTLSSTQPLYSQNVQHSLNNDNLVLDGFAPPSQTVRDSLKQYNGVRYASLVGWTNDGKLLIKTQFGETTQLHSVATPLGMRRQLTFEDEPINTVAINPASDKNSILYLRDVGGAEHYQIFLQDLNTGKSRMLSDGKGRHIDPVWSKDGKQFSFGATSRNGKDWDIYVSSLDSKPRLVFESSEGGYWYPYDWSPDGKYLLVVNYQSVNDSRLYLLELSSGKLKSLTPSKHKVSNQDAFFSENGRSVFFTTDQHSQFQDLVKLDLASGKQSIITEDISWDVEYSEPSPSGDVVAYVVNEEGFSKLYLHDLTTGKANMVEGVPPGVINNLQFDSQGENLAIGVSGPRFSDVLVLSMVDGKITQWTASEMAGLNPKQFIEPTLIHYPTFDEVDGERRKISALYYRPEGKGPFPVMIRIHGGPEGQSRPWNNEILQYYLKELKVALISPNVRGSTGYGKDFLKLDNGFRREDSVRDIGALLDWIEGQKELDTKRVGVFGGSYGGYMVLATMVHYGKRIRAGIDFFGISNFNTFLANTEDYRRDQRRKEYGDNRDQKMRDFLEKISPSNHAHKITSPLLIAQGANDPRVPESESRQMVDRVRASGGTVWYFLAKNEGHGFSKKANWSELRAVFVTFLKQHLLDEESSS